MFNTRFKVRLKFEKLKTLDISWIMLMLITLANALVAETADKSLFITAVICFSIAFKGRRIMDYFMELNHANKTIQLFMRGYFYVFPLLIFLADLFSEPLAAITAL